MENKENKIKAVRLSDDELENVSGGAAPNMLGCTKCGYAFYIDKVFDGVCCPQCGNEF